MTPHEFLDKCQWEGGRLFIGFEYGLRAKDLDDSNPEFKALIQKYEDHYLEFKSVQDEIEQEAIEAIEYDWE